jgi:(p)ppGpp synthase/HD superfamily hydrolase
MYQQNTMTTYSDRYEAALTLAACAHRGQTRKGGDVPYIVHPVHVATILLRYGFPEEVIVAGLLHDVVEDTDVPLARIETEFGPAVASMVAALTEVKQEGGVQRAWEMRKRELLDLVRNASPEAAAVKAADTLHNARTLASELRREGASFWRHLSRGPEPSIWYYRSVAAVVRERLGAHLLVDELDAAVDDLERAIAETGSN